MYIHTVVPLYTCKQITHTYTHRDTFKQDGMFGQSYLHRLLIGSLKLSCGVSPEALNPNGLNLYWHMSIRHRLSEWEFKLGFSRASQPWKLKSWVVVAIKYSWTAVIAQGWFFYNCTFISVIGPSALVQRGLFPPQGKAVAGPLLQDKGNYQRRHAPVADLYSSLLLEVTFDVSLRVISGRNVDSYYSCCSLKAELLGVLIDLDKLNKTPVHSSLCGILRTKFLSYEVQGDCVLHCIATSSLDLSLFAAFATHVQPLWKSSVTLVSSDLRKLPGGRHQCLLSLLSLYWTSHHMYLLPLRGGTIWNLCGSSHRW